MPARDTKLTLIPSSGCDPSARVGTWQAELELVLGEIMSCEQGLKETRRELDVLPRQTESKDKNLWEQLEALAVQVQDSDNEMDALEDTGVFIEKTAALVEGALHLQRLALSQVASAPALCLPCLVPACASIALSQAGIARDEEHVLYLPSSRDARMAHGLWP